MSSTSDPVREAAKRELRRREWASKRGKATRACLRDHPEFAEQFEREGTIDLRGILPEHVTRASLILELNQRAKRREASQAARAWLREHPRQAEEVAEGVR